MKVGILYDSFYRKCPEKSNLQRQKRDWLLLTAGGGENGE
jgi:hypothetical protein